MKWVRDRMGWPIGIATPEEEEADWEKVEVHEGHPVRMLRRTTLNSYSLQVMCPAEDYEHVHRETDADKRVLADLPAMLEQVEEELERRLPDGYRIRITEWNK